MDLVDSMDQLTTTVESSDLPDGIPIAVPRRIPVAGTNAAPANSRQVVGSEPTSQAQATVSSLSNCTAEAKCCITSNCSKDLCTCFT